MTRVHRRCFVLVVVGTLAGFSAPAVADSLSIDRTVTSVVSDPGTQTRAIAGDRRGAYLVIERLHDRRGSEQLRIVELPLGGRNVPLSAFRNLTLTSLKGSSLTFALSRGRSDIQCAATLAFGRGRVDVHQLSCSQAGQVYQPEPEPTPEPQGPSMSDIKEASTACEKLGSFDSDRKKCVDLTLELMKTRYRRTASATVAACVAGFSFTSERLWCLGAVAQTKRDPAELVRYCTEQSQWESERKQCVTKFGSL